jgi:hypothetical protein
MVSAPVPGDDLSPALYKGAATVTSERSERCGTVTIRA